MRSRTQHGVQERGGLRRVRHKKGRQERAVSKKRNTIHCESIADLTTAKKYFVQKVNVNGAWISMACSPVLFGEFISVVHSCSPGGVPKT